MNNSQKIKWWKKISGLKKTLLITACTILLFAILIIVFISPITKYLVEKYDERYTGRQITMDWAYVNPFTGYIHFNNFKINESKSDSVFFTSAGVSINFSLIKLLSKTYEINAITLDNPVGIIHQYHDTLNFDDLIELFSSKKDTVSTKEPVNFNILNFKIRNGEFIYLDHQTPIHYSIKNVQFESPGMRWDSDTIAANFSFSSGVGKGEVKGDFTINTDNLDYRYSVIVKKFDLDIIEQYLKDLTNYGSFRAYLDADIKSKGNFKDKENVTTSGMLSISDFHFGKNPKEDYASFKQLKLLIHELSPKKKIYFYDLITLIEPYFKYERYDYLDNIETIFGRDGENITETSNSSRFNLVIEIANYIKVISRNFLQSHFKITHFDIVKGNIKFNDYSLSEKFSAELNPLSITADSIDKKNERANIFLQSGIIPFGEVKAHLSINPKDSSDFDIFYKVEKIPFAVFNPYTITYTSFPINRGTLELNGTWNVRNGIIQSNNHLLLIDPRTAKRLKNKDVNWIPLPLVMAFVRERGNIIDYEIPISGNLKDPKFHLHDVVFDIMENIFVKPVTTPYRIEVKSTETEIEKSLSVVWEMRKSSLDPKQQDFLEKIAQFLSEKPEATVTVFPHQYSVKEKEYILLYESKKAYYLSKHNFKDSTLNETDKVAIDKTSAKDSSFIRFLNKMVKDSLLFTIQDKCILLLGAPKVDNELKRLMNDREQAFMSFFIKRNVQNQVHLSKVENVIPFNGFSYYKIDYKGDVPKTLQKAYEKMNDLDGKAPRNKFKDARKKNNSVLKN